MEESRVKTADDIKIKYKAMKVTIEITCTDDDKMLNHLSDIRKKVKKFLEKSEESSDDAYHFSHNNCDGYYSLNVDLDS